MELIKENRQVLLASILFALVASVLMVRNQPLLWLLPFVALPALFLVLKTEQFLYVLAFLVPLSISLEDVNIENLGISFPSEPLLFLYLLLLVLLLLSGALRIEREIIRHPVTIALFAYLAAVFVTALFSGDVLISMKNFLSQTWFSVPVYLLTVKLFRQPDNFNKIMNVFVASFAIVVAYTFANHFVNGFSERSAHWVMQPFYKDHTLLGACLALVIPYTTVQVFSKSNSQLLRLLFLGITGLLVTVLIMTFSRAALLSCVLSFGILVLIKIGWKQKHTIVAILLMMVLWLQFSDQILDRLASNKTDSSDDLVENVESITNISTDASNLERINRWYSAMEMWREKPLVGWGPGRFQFEYAPFQTNENLTIISTNIGDVGNAHSEYLGRLAEMGLVGTIPFMLLMVLVFRSNFRHIYHVPRGKHYQNLLIVGMGLTSYFIHGFLNNFMDTDKASFVIWLFCGYIVAMDIYYQKERSKKTIPSQINPTDKSPEVV